MIYLIVRYLTHTILIVRQASMTNNVDTEGEDDEEGNEKKTQDGNDDKILVDFLH